MALGWELGALIWHPIPQVSRLLLAGGSLTLEKGCVPVLHSGAVPADPQSTAPSWVPSGKQTCGKVLAGPRGASCVFGRWEGQI